MLDDQARALIEWMYAARVLGEKSGLDNMRALCSALGNPERSIGAIHVAGTNGKGSVCAFIERALRENGLKTGLYTSPYLSRYNERIRIEGEPISDEMLVAAASRVKRVADELAPLGIRPTTFELGTAVAFCAFEAADIDIAVIETGIGGRLDPTNVLTPIASVIATIGLDHIAILGDTLGKIAHEKAGILKRGVPAVFYPQDSEARRVLDDAARALDCPVARAEDYPMTHATQGPYGSSFEIVLPVLGRLSVRVGLPGEHQAENARLALTALALLAGHGLRLDPRAVERGLERTVWPGRLEWVAPGILLDGAHNPQGARALAGYLGRFFAGRNIVLVTGMMADKQPPAYVGILAPLVSRVITTRVDWPRALSPDDLAALYRAQGCPAKSCPDPARALQIALDGAAEDALVVVAGSLYLVGELRGHLVANS